MAKTIHLNKNGLPYCGTKSKDPNIIGDSDTGYYPYEVTCKRCRKKAEKNGIKFVSPQSLRQEQNQTKTDQNQTTGKKEPEFKIQDMSEFDNDPEWISIKDEMPPLSVDIINTVDCLYKSVDEVLSVVANHHIRDDINLLRFSRVTHWKHRK